jgi:tRNA(Ile)-lysidine synthase
MVARTAQEWGIPLETAVIDVPSYIKETGMNAQAAAREKRYAFFKDAAAAHGAELLMLGHHADDQAETVLMRIIRGTGVGGLAGIPYRRKEDHLELVRPLLRVTKKELLSYCARNGVPYAIDSSNLSRKYFRNAVRLDILPMLRRMNPRAEEALVRLAELAAADDDFLEEEASRLLATVAVRSGEGFRVDLAQFGGLHVALQRRIVKLILKYSSDCWFSLEFQKLDELLEAMADPKKTVNRIDIGDGWVFIREYGEAYIGPIMKNSGGYCYEVSEIPCTIRLEACGRLLEIERLEPSVTSLPGNRQEAFFDESGLAMPLYVRTRRPGDRLYPDGLNGSKKVQDIFVDAKIPRAQRDVWPLLADGEGRILWVPGLRRSRFARAGSHAKSIIRVCIRPDSG